VVLPIDYRIGAVSLGCFNRGHLPAGLNNIYDIGDRFTESSGGGRRGIIEGILEIHLVV
jgi:hypothetical protein